MLSQAEILETEIENSEADSKDNVHFLPPKSPLEKANMMS